MSDTTKKTNIDFGELFSTAMNWVNEKATDIQKFFKTMTEEHSNKAEDGYIYCDNCGNRCVNTNIVLTSLPAQYKYVCPVCGKEVTSFRNVYHPDDEDLYKRWQNGESISTVNAENSTNEGQEITANVENTTLPITTEEITASVENATLPLTKEEEERINVLYKLIVNLTDVEKRIEFVKDKLLHDYLPSMTLGEVLDLLSKERELYLKQIMPANSTDEH